MCCSELIVYIRVMQLIRGSISLEQTSQWSKSERERKTAFEKKSRLLMCWLCALMWLHSFKRSNAKFYYRLCRFTLPHRCNICFVALQYTHSLLITSINFYDCCQWCLIFVSCVCGFFSRFLRTSWIALLFDCRFV